MQESKNLPRDLTPEERMELVIRRLALQAKGNARERAAAAQNIGDYTIYGLMMTEQVLDILLDLLRDEEVTVRRTSAKVLSGIGVRNLHSVERRDQVFGPLLRAAEGDPDPEVRRYASGAIRDIREIDKFGWGASEWGDEKRGREKL